MRCKVIRVLKKEQVKAGGSVQLGDCADTPVESVGTTARQARIVESNNEYAIIEIICGCGQKTHVQCNYSQLTGSGQE